MNNRMLVRGMFLAFLGCMSLFSPSARAFVIVVTDTNDTTSVQSLRGAGIATNSRGGTTTIILGCQSDKKKRTVSGPWIYSLFLWS